MRANAMHVGGRSVIADEERCVETGVDAGHHASVAGPGTDNAYVLGEVLNEKAFAVSMGITHQDFGGPRLLGSAHCRQSFVGHEMPEAFVLEACWTELIGGHDSCHTLHIHGNVDLEFL